MNEIMKMNNEEVVTLDSREVAEMLDKRHDLLLREIEGSKDGKTVGIIPTLENANFVVSNFFIKSTYKSGTREYKCYQITKMGCELIGNKQQGEKGIIFTAKYVERFNKMEKSIKELKINKSVSLANIDATALVTSIVNTTLQLMNDNNREIEKRINEVEINANNIITEQEIKHDNRINEITKLIGLKSKNVKSLTNLLKTRISDLKGYSVNADDYHYVLAKELILRKLNVFKWEDVPIEKYNEVHSIIDNIDTIKSTRELIDII